MIEEKIKPELVDVQHAVAYCLSHQLYNADLVKLEPAPEYREYGTAFKVISKHPSPEVINQLYVTSGIIFVVIDYEEINITLRDLDSLNLNPVLVEFIKNSVEQFIMASTVPKW